MKNYPDIRWEVFAFVNADATYEFENMCRRLFRAKFLENQEIPHSDHNNKGIEVLPILEPIRSDGKPRKWISFQSKYTDSPASAYAKFKHSAQITAENYEGQLDLVYLFCNKTLTTSSKSYKEIVRIHKEAGIDVKPISGDELLDLVAAHTDIANYYFRPRDIQLGNYELCNKAELPAITIKVDSTDGEVRTGVLQLKPINEQLLKDLVREKSAACRGYACRMNLDAIKSELETLFSYDIEQYPEAKELYFIKLLVDLRDNKDVSSQVERCEDKRGAEWVIEFYREPRALNKGEFMLLDPIIQIFVTDKMFTSGIWKEFGELYLDVREQISHDIRKQFDLYYGLSLFNMQNDMEAAEVLYGLYDTEKEERFLFYALCADIKKRNVQYQSGFKANAEGLISLLDQLDGLKNIKQYSQQNLLVAALCMEAYYHLGMTYDNAFVERAIEKYKDYPQDIRNNAVVSFYYAICLELNGNRSDAIDIYASLDWKSELAFAERYMICSIIDGQLDKAVSIYEELSDKNSRMESVYLFALYRNGDDTYEKKLQEAVELHEDDLEALFNIAYFIEGEQYKDIVMPVLKNHINDRDTIELRLDQMVQLVVLLAHFGEIGMLETVLGRFDDPMDLNSFALNEVYKSIVNVANREYIRLDKPLDKPEDFKAAERIADRILEAVGRNSQGVAQDNRAKFLNVKVLCAGAEQLPFKSLKYSKELFDIRESAELARNIVGLLIDTKVRDLKKYVPYLDVLEESEKPEHCIVIAAAMQLIGREDTSEFYAYKALYLLNGKDDYGIFKEYFNYCNYNMRWINQNYQLKSVRHGTVVSLTEIDTADAPGHLMICLDSEAEFSDRGNRSMDVEHVTYGSTDYIKLYNSGIGQERDFRGRKYRIDQIIPRTLYGLHYVFRKAQDKPDMFKGVIWMFDTQDAEELIKKLRDMDAERSEHIRSLLDSYNFKDNQIGLPIDSIASVDYERYISAFQYCLYTKDEAFYAGQPVFEDETGQKYVPALSTLVLAATLDRFDVFDAIRDEMIIPESYIVFLKERYERSYTNDPDSRSTLFFVEDKPVLQKMDMKTAEMWERILTFCEECYRMDVTNDERVSLEIIEGFTAERLMKGFMLSFIHLDSLALAKRENATYLCDDLFFRKIASSANIRNINTVSIVEHYMNADIVTDYILELSKTNYIYIPLLARDDEQARQLFCNIMDGEKKRFYYIEIIDKLQKIREHFLRELYGNEYVDRQLEEGTEA